MSQAYLRDVQLDMYRGLLMIYIVCVIHVSGWLDYFNEPYSNLLLWEMPAIFYVAGASASLAAKKGFIEQFKNRLKRVYYPYLLLALLYITAMVLLYALPSHPASFTNLISEYNLYDWVSVFWGGVYSWITIYLALVVCRSIFTN